MISIVQNGPEYEIRFPYNPALVNIVKRVPGRHWYPDGKFWTIPKDKIGFYINLVKGTSFESQLDIKSNEDLNRIVQVDEPRKQHIPDIDISDVKTYVKDGGKLFKHQEDCIKYMIGRKEQGNFNGFLLADEMGCCHEDSIVSVKYFYKNNVHPMDVTLKQLWEKFEPGCGMEIKCLVDGRFKYMPIKFVANKGVRDVVKVSIENDYSLICTPDHEVYTDRGWMCAGDLSCSNKVFTNGDLTALKCPNCGSTKNLVTYKYSKFRGYCKKCMYQMRTGTKYKDDSTRKAITSHGYVALYGGGIRKSKSWNVLPHCSDGNYGILEHHYVWWKNTGHAIDTSHEVIHHINGNKQDNRFENLELMTDAEHKKLHRDVGSYNLTYNRTDFFKKSDGSYVYFVPELRQVKSVEKYKDSLVFDVEIDSECVHNFICNGVVVHNCISGDATVIVSQGGKTVPMSLECLHEQFNKDKCIPWRIKSYVQETRRFEFLPIRCVLDKGRKSTVTVTLANHETLTCTPDHEVLLANGSWTQAASLRKGDQVCCCSSSCTSESYLNQVEVQKVEDCGVCNVYDVGVLSKSNHNFVANTVVVHNCGKTLEVINMALFKKQYEQAKHCLIICCVNTAKYNWADDIKLHTNGEYEGYILGSRQQKRKGTVRLDGSGKEKLEDLETGLMYSDKDLNRPLPYFLIVNIEALRTTDRSKKKRERNVFTRKLAQMCLDGDISMIAIDEIHRNASPQSSQGSQILKLKEMTGNSVEWIPMTGTPVVNKPTDVFLPMYLVGAHNNKSFWLWNQHYCIYGGYGGHNIIGYKNLPEMKSILEPNMLRRTKDEVLDLPPKIHHVEYVENTPRQKKLYQEVVMDMWSNMDEIRKSPNPLTQFIRLRQVNGCPELVDEEIDVTSKIYPTVNAKINRLLNLVQDLVSNGEKVVVFSNWVAPLRTAYRTLKQHKINVVSYTGTMTAEDREANKQKFVSDPRCQVIVGTIGAMGVSHTLSVASNVIFLDLPWNAATQDQAEDRCYRLNSTKPVNVYQIITKDTVDEKVYDIIQRKRGTADYVVDNTLNFKEHPELMEYLLS